MMSGYWQNKRVNDSLDHYEEHHVVPLSATS